MNKLYVVEWQGVRGSWYIDRVSTTVNGAKRSLATRRRMSVLPHRIRIYEPSKKKGSIIK